MIDPLVTCICPTMPIRREWLIKAMGCFESQSYRRLEFLSDPQPGLIGEKRNRLCGSAKGDIIVHFDDDDWSAPGRIADQVQRLIESGKAITGYHSIRFTDGERWWRNINAHTWAFGTSLCYWREWWLRHPFPNVQLGEDRDFVQFAAREKQLISVDAGDLMHATNHPGNTSKRVIGNGWELTDPPPYVH